MSQNPRSRIRRRLLGRVLVLAAITLIAVIVGTLALSIRGGRKLLPGFGAGAREARDVYAGALYENANPRVAYVGDEACVGCHRAIAEDYRTHPMGRSLAPIDAGRGTPPAGAGEKALFEWNGLQFSAEHRDGRVFHKATRREPGGETLAEVECEVKYALGSGTRGASFLVERDGFVSLSPVAWFAQEGRWGVSPGYGEGSQQTNFERAVYPECLYCHANQVRPVAGPLNRYETPVFRGHAIGCERCHGPGGLHVREDARAASPGRTIVNPASLAPELRESVCQQCHLQGAFRTPRAGLGAFDYRPGLPLHRFWAVFQRPDGSREQSDAVGHVEQLGTSRCFLESEGRLGCISCHDPHKLPEPSAKADYYRRRCLDCHQQRGCSLPRAEREARGQAEDCVGCHMPRLKVANIPHTAATDHRIPRGVPGRDAGRPRAPAGPDARALLVDYFDARRTEEERSAGRRDLGVALAWVSGRLGPKSGLTTMSATQAVPLLQEALRDRPDDRAAGNSLGAALEALGRGPEALDAYEAVLRAAPDDEMALRSSGSLAASLRRYDLARESLRRTIAVNPWRSDYRLALAKILSQAGDWPGALAAAREALGLDPNQPEARSILIQGHLRAGEAAKAEAELQTLLRFYPAGREIWQQWYEDQKRAAAAGGNPL
ncbi:cytochrome c nitrite reductase pentaheme subunit [Aquisphaera giovannonii]|uniref:Cytochrome c nitrite reductase pentaheme subunit n=1 Tax=Aquisphaera giovannonii TaxID=406548 RepID=A0A5B9WDX0_9BACT|nr:tetratricopeptide repeat protein [Aquisphaera giovannonii]QEH38836.1 cytochrome c nitrite reductase pentaheme subunit [Aquisphaera giovannonii]